MCVTTGGTAPPRFFLSSTGKDEVQNLEQGFEFKFQRDI